MKLKKRKPGNLVIEMSVKDFKAILEVLGTCPTYLSKTDSEFHHKVYGKLREIAKEEGLLYEA